MRIEFPGAVYHVTSRGDRREPIYRDDVDRQTQLEVLAQVMDRLDAQALAYCLMGNHYHLVLHTRQANLSRLMRHFNGVHTQAYKRRHGLARHFSQGRFKAILVDRDAHLLALCRYVERNPVAAGLVVSAGDWMGPVTVSMWEVLQRRLGWTVRACMVIGCVTRWPIQLIRAVGEQESGLKYKGLTLAPLQHRGHTLLSAGRSIGVQRG